MASLNMTSSEITLGTKTASVDIPKPRQGGHLFGGRDTFAAMPAKSVPVPGPSQMLPTPPNSISPSLPPHEFRARGHPITGKLPTPRPLDADLDLRDTLNDSTDHDPARLGGALRDSEGGGHEAGISDYFDAAGAITPALLAKYHLPEVLLAHGPLAIRHLIGYLTTSVPGFSRIPPTKARRLVVGALEGRAHGGDGGGLNGDVEFEKVGWGRWDARIKGQPFRESRSSLSGAIFTPPASLSSSHSAYSAKGFPFPSNARHADGTHFGTSWTDDSIVFSHDEELEFMDREDDMMLDHDADKVSLDNDGSYSSSEAPEEEEELPNIEDDGGDVTDEEDWANIGAAALRQAYIPRKRSGHRYPIIHGPPRKRVACLAAGGSTRLKPPRDMTDGNKENAIHSIAGLDVASDSQERDAIEALVRLSNI